jgi:hypothetical protein
MEQPRNALEIYNTERHTSEARLAALRLPNHSRGGWLIRAS